MLDGDVSIPLGGRDQQALALSSHLRVELNVNQKKMKDKSK